MSGYVITENSVKALISFKNIMNLCRMLLNLFNNPTQISTKDNSKTLISEQKKQNTTVEYYLFNQCNKYLTLNENYTTRDTFWTSFLLYMLENTILHLH